MTQFESLSDEMNMHALDPLITYFARLGVIKEELHCHLLNFVQCRNAYTHKKMLIYYSPIWYQRTHGAVPKLAAFIIDFQRNRHMK